MNDAASGTQSVLVEREIAHPPEKIWRALTQLTGPVGVLSLPPLVMPGLLGPHR